MEQEFNAAETDPTLRRRFLGSGAVAAVAAVVAGAAVAAEPMGHAMPGKASANGIKFGKDEKACATCAFWGGSRQVEKGAGVLATSLGVCSNPASANYQKMTSPDHVMPQWIRWQALG